MKLESMVICKGYKHNLASSTPLCSAKTKDIHCSSSRLFEHDPSQLQLSRTPNSILLQASAIRKVLDEKYWVASSKVFPIGLAHQLYEP